MCIATAATHVVAAHAGYQRKSTSVESLVLVLLLFITKKLESSGFASDENIQASGVPHKSQYRCIVEARTRSTKQVRELFSLPKCRDSDTNLKELEIRKVLVGSLKSLTVFAKLCVVGGSNGYIR